MSTILSYGSWKSPITAEVVASGGIAIGQAALDGDDTYWLESRPTEGGRMTLVRLRRDGDVSDLLPAPWNVRTRVHEYGGGAFVVSRGTVYFSNLSDQRLYRLTPGTEPVPLTPAADMRYADGVVDERRGLLFCVREDHTAPGEPVNTIAGLPLAVGSAGRVLVSGSDFYSSPRLSPDSRRLAWLTWNHPNMPWDGTELWVGNLDEAGGIVRPEKVAGGPEESIFQPEWSPDGRLHFVSDRTGWWNLYRRTDDVVEPLTPLEAEFGLPQWVFGMSTYAFASARQIVCAYTRDGAWRLARLDTTSRTLRPLDIPYTQIGNVRTSGTTVVFSGGAPDRSTALVRLDLSDGSIEEIRHTTERPVDVAYISAPHPFEFPTAGGLTAHAFYYPPRNPEYRAPKCEKPPLLLMSHGGPTAAAGASLSLETQFWTSRGFGVVDVNYGGSTGYGRAYRERLEGNWGVVDVADCVNAAESLVRTGQVDAERVAIRGGSAGGYTTLCALIFHHICKAGACYYGVSDLEALARDTHKFESRYLDRLIGPYPERRDLYITRSPIHHVDQMECPTIFFQGLDDRVVPPNQTEEIVNALRRKAIPVAYLAFAGEQHGFRRAENIKRSLEAELYFYSRVFGFPLAEPVAPVEIENLGGEAGTPE